jgi:RNA polymerase sigma-70 factor, ECF subfamily
MRVMAPAATFTEPVAPASGSDSLARVQEPPDDVIIARVLAGDTDLFALLVRRYQGALCRHAVAMVLDHDVASDMVQDTFVRAYRQLETCRDRQHFRAWLFRTLRNRCLDHLKEARRHDARLDGTEPIVDPAAGPDAPVVRAGMRAELVRALAGIPEAQREALMMRCVEELSYEEMADLLDVSVSALKMRVLRAKEALSAALAGRV